MEPVVSPPAWKNHVVNTDLPRRLKRFAVTGSHWLCEFDKTKLLD